MKPKTKGPSWAWTAGAFTVMVLVGVFQNLVAARLQGTPPMQFAEAVGKALFTEELWKALGSTLFRFSIGFSMALVAASILGIAMGRVKRVEDFFSVGVNVLRPIPSAAIIPFAMFIFAYGGISMKLFVIIYGVFWPILLQVWQGAKDIDPILLATGKTLGKRRFKMFIQIIVPATLPSIMVGARVGLGVGLLLAVTTEILIASDPGIGYLILDYERSFKYAPMVGAIILLGLVGWVLDFIFVKIERWCLPWHHGRNL